MAADRGGEFNRRGFSLFGPLREGGIAWHDFRKVVRLTRPDWSPVETTAYRPDAPPVEA
jgi:hypothetical protein